MLLLLIANGALYNRGLVSGHDHSSAIRAGSHLAPILFLCLWKNTSLWRLFPKHARSLTIFFLILILLVPNPLSHSDLLSRFNELLPKNRVEIPSDWTNSNIERLGSIYLPPQQANRLGEIVDFLRESESFWDFTDHGALYFLSEHLSPTRFYATHHVITLTNQQEVVHDLAQNSPRYILFRSNTGWDAIAGVDRTLRNFLVSEYLLTHYHVSDKIGEFTILERGAPGISPPPLDFRVNLGYMPFLWGQDKRQHYVDLYSHSFLKWDLAPGNWEHWQIIKDISFREDSGYMSIIGADPGIQNLTLRLDPRAVTYLAIELEIEGKLDNNFAQVFWRSGEATFAEERSIRFNVLPDGQSHLYLVRLISFPGWTWSETVTGLRFDLPNEVGIQAKIDTMGFIHVDEFTR
jgi:hypothetical protein